MFSCWAGESNQGVEDAAYAGEGLGLWWEGRGRKLIIYFFFSEGDVVSLHLLQLAFGDRKRLASGQVMYEVRHVCV